MSAESSTEPAVDEPTEAEVPTPPSIEVVGDATAEQVAALVAVLSAAGGGEDEEPSGPASRWASRERLVRAPVHPAPGAWRASGFPG